MSVNVLSTKVLIEDMIFTSPQVTGDGTASSCANRSHAKNLAVWRAKYAAPLFSVILRPLVLALGIEPETFRSAVKRVDWKTVGFFLKISKEIGKAWRKTLSGAKLASLERPTDVWGERLFSATFQTFCLTAHACLNTQKYGLFCSLSSALPTELIPPQWKNFQNRFLIKVLLSSSLAQKDGNKWWAIAT